MQANDKRTRKQFINETTNQSINQGRMLSKSNSFIKSINQSTIRSAQPENSDFKINVNEKLGLQK